MMPDILPAWAVAVGAFGIGLILFMLAKRRQRQRRHGPMIRNIRKW